MFSHHFIHIHSFFSPFSTLLPYFIIFLTYLKMLIDLLPQSYLFLFYQNYFTKKQHIKHFLLRFTCSICLSASGLICGHLCLFLLFSTCFLSYTLFYARFTLFLDRFYSKTQTRRYFTERSKNFFSEASPSLLSATKISNQVRFVDNYIFSIFYIIY